MGLANFDSRAELFNETYEHPSAYPGILDSLVNDGYIGRKAFGLALGDWETDKGAITFGGVDRSRYTGDLVAVPLPVSTISNPCRSY